MNVPNRDLRVAGIPKVDERGRSLDVHAMRLTFATMLSKGGVSPKVAQLAMRHSDIRLTMETYTDPKLLDIAGAIDSLPALNPARESKSPKESKGKDGQSDAVADEWLVPLLVPAVGTNPHSMPSADILTAEATSDNHRSNRDRGRTKPTKKALSESNSDKASEIGTTGDWHFLTNEQAGRSLDVFLRFGLDSLQRCSSECPNRFEAE